MNNKIMMGFVALFVLSIISLGVIAYKGNPEIQGPNYNADVHEELEAAMDAGDYNLWLSIREENNLPTRGKIFQVIGADNFDKYVAMHEANLAGDADAANLIRQELGLGQGMMKGKSMNAQASQGKGMQIKGNGIRMQQFADSDNDGVCDNFANRN